MNFKPLILGLVLVSGTVGAAEYSPSFLYQICDHYKGIPLSKKFAPTPGITLDQACRKEVEAGKGMGGVWTLLTMRWHGDCLQDAGEDRGLKEACTNWNHESRGYLAAVMDFQKDYLSCALLKDEKAVVPKDKSKAEGVKR